jgi:hypothetical protein
MFWVFLPAIFLAVVGALATVPGGLRRAHERRQRLAMPDRPEDHAFVTLRGTVKLAAAQLVAPLSGRSCVAYRAAARTFAPAIGGGRTVDAQKIEIAMTPFVLATKHGEVIVDGNTCELPVHSSPIIPRKLHLEQRFLERTMMFDEASAAGFDEIIVKPGMKIAVHGVVRVEVIPSGGEVGFRDVPKQLRISGEPLVIDLD